MRIRYFAWVRERIGIDEEEVTPPAGVATVGDLLDWLKGRGEGYAYALADPHVVRVAVDQFHAARDEPIGGAREIALFPPMTGG